ncbi:sterol carrier family protein [Streptomyces sp. NPDC051976]|uniref:maleylpyruvate isomerase family mycothiol-dependent enzyme n=1 Tax=Streptomyces sp. NPDC051976 TaxID=3154947 RepID=UPI00344260AF
MPPRNRARARTYDPARTWGALIAQVGHVREAVRGLGQEEWGLASGLPGWDVRTLVAHVVRQIAVVEELLAEPPRGSAVGLTDLDAWAVSTATISDQLDASAKDAAAAMADPVAALDEAARTLAAQEAEAVRTDRLLARPFNGMRALDFTVTRLVELVVHSDDLARATGRPVELDRQAVAAVVRLLADALAAKAPGNAVEVRIPPYAAVQCVEGPRHTRGTPPNVVETDPLTWIRLATGRTTWPAALSTPTISASGDRADLTPYLPILG